MQIQFLSQANSNYMVDADVVSCYLHAFALGDGGTRITDAEADFISEKLE